MTGTDSLLLHPLTAIRISNALLDPPHAFLITGAAGSGKTALAKTIAASLLQFSSAVELERYPYFLHVQKHDGKQEIPIDTVRQIIKATGLKTPGMSSIRRLFLIEDAHLMSREAQNALLKVLEEPPSDSVFILTAPGASSLLPTIASRCQEIPVRPVSLKRAADFYKGIYEAEKLESAWSLSHGHASLLDTLLSDGQAHPLKSSIQSAKIFLKLQPYERLLMLESLGNNKDELRQFLDALGKVIAALHKAAITNGRHKQAKSLLNCRKQIYDSLDALDNNANPKMLSLDVFLNFTI